MKKKKEELMNWDEAPDIITPHDLSKITGIGIQSCRKIFDDSKFPLISKKLIGNQYVADKEAVRLYLQGFDIKSKDKSALLMLIYQELQTINKNYNIKNEENLESDEEEL